jgi:hypothetical protein
MSSKAIALFLALAFAPALAVAQSAPPAPPAPPAASASPGAPPMMTHEQMRAHMRIFRQFHDQAERLHDAARAAMLGALSAAHRSLLARIVGNLAVSAHPDRHAAARQLDGALSAREKHYILNEARYVKDQMQTLMGHMRSQMMSMMTRQQRQGMATMHAHMHGRTMMGRWQHHGAPDAGEILLQFATNEHPPMGMQIMMMVHHPH